MPMRILTPSAASDGGVEPAGLGTHRQALPLSGLGGRAEAPFRQAGHHTADQVADGAAGRTVGLGEGRPSHADDDLPRPEIQALEPEVPPADLTPHPHDEARRFLCPEPEGFSITASRKRAARMAATRQQLAPPPPPSPSSASTAFCNATSVSGRIRR